MLSWSTLFDIVWPIGCHTATRNGIISCTLILHVICKSALCTCITIIFNSGIQVISKLLIWHKLSFDISSDERKSRSSNIKLINLNFFQTFLLHRIDIRNALGLFPLPILCWIVIFFVPIEGDNIANYIFTILVSLQGFELFIFHCVMDKQVL